MRDLWCIITPETYKYCACVLSIYSTVDQDNVIYLEERGEREKKKKRSRRRRRRRKRKRKKKKKKKKKKEKDYNNTQF